MEEKKEMTGYVLFRFSKKTGNIDTTMTDPFGVGLMELWALQNTTPSKRTIVIDAEDGKIVYAVDGRKERLPKALRPTDAWCSDFGISLDAVQAILKEDKRFNA